MELLFPQQAVLFATPCSLEKDDLFQPFIVSDARPYNTFCHSALAE